MVTIGLGASAGDFVTYFQKQNLAFEVPHEVPQAVPHAVPCAGPHEVQTQYRTRG